MSFPVIHIENISKRYRLGCVDHRSFYRDCKAQLARWMGRNDSAGDDWFMALDNVSFDIYEGEAVALVGRNGAGKTTLANIISEIIYPTSGSVKIRGRISTLGSGVGFSGELTARDNIFINGAVLGMRRQEVARRFDEIIDFAEIDRFVDSPIKHYSTGMKARLAFSTAMHFIADIIIIDEALNGGDRFFRQKAEEKINSLLREQGKTVIMVSHSEGQLQKICRRGILLEQGKVVCDDTITGSLELYNKQVIKKAA
jgi:lipopolysaccharide transport system ATP-binding protein